MCSIELQKFRLTGKQNRRRTSKQPPPRHKQGEKFLKGPIPLKWLINASSLPGKSLHIAIVVWYRAGLEKSRTIKLSNITVKVFGLTPPSSMVEVQKARNREIKKYHSDRFIKDPEKFETSKEIMQILNLAYDRLEEHYKKTNR